jgi:hypothetical protein
MRSSYISLVTVALGLLLSTSPAFAGNLEAWQKYFAQAQTLDFSKLPSGSNVWVNNRGGGSSAEPTDPVAILFLSNNPVQPQAFGGTGRCDSRADFYQCRAMAAQSAIASRGVLTKDTNGDYVTYPVLQNGKVKMTYRQSGHYIIVQGETLPGHEIFNYTLIDLDNDKFSY